MPDKNGQYRMSLEKRCFQYQADQFGSRSVPSLKQLNGKMEGRGCLAAGLARRAFVWTMGGIYLPCNPSFPDSRCRLNCPANPLSRGLPVPENRIDLDRIIAESFVAQVERHASIDSTNDRAKQSARVANQTLPLLIQADRQTAGRGRGSAKWWTGPGSLAFSLLVDLQGQAADPSRRPLVGLGAAVAVVEAVAPLIPSHRIGLHWPNDVLADGRKLAGILVEVPTDPRRDCDLLAASLASQEPMPQRARELRTRLIIGIGLNTNNSMADAPPELRDIATTLLDLAAARHDQTDVLVALLNRLEAVLGLLATDPDKIGVRANSLCLQHGETLTLRLGTKSITGRCAGIAPDGSLLLDTPDGRQAFRSGSLR